ncbi:MAG TPA: DUF6622 family protein [Stellaceae bacterium]|nr:DUF6622 family protein [Stellaceae bacterium]
MPALTAILSGTPWWVFVLFAVFVALGVQALKPRSLPLARVFITPAVFIGWGLSSLVAAAKAAPLVLPGAIAAAAIGFALAALTVRLDALRAEPGRVTLPGSALPLFRNLLIFAAKYVIAVASAMRPDWHPTLLLADMAVSGLAIGYFLGWTLRLVGGYRRALRLETMAASRRLAPAFDEVMMRRAG